MVVIIEYGFLGEENIGVWIVGYGLGNCWGLFICCGVFCLIWIVVIVNCGI